MDNEDNRNIENCYELEFEVPALHWKRSEAGDEHDYVGIKLLVSHRNVIVLDIEGNNGRRSSLEFSPTIAIRLMAMLEEAIDISFDNHVHELESKKTLDIALYGGE